MASNITRKALLIAATLASLAFGASQAGALASSLPGASGGQSGILAPSASPYALLAPVTISRDPNEGRAAFQGRASLCKAGETEIATDFGWRCRPNW
jgi:hypothetical protein